MLILLTAKVNVCLVSTNAYPLFNENCNAPFGGAELQVFLLSTQLAQDKNYSVSVVVGDFGQNDDEVLHHVRLVKAHARSGGLLSRLLAPYKLLKAIARARPDVIIQRASGPETGVCAFYARNRKTRFIYSLAHDAELVGKSVASHHFIYRHLYNYGVKKADVLVVQSQGQMQKLGQYNQNWSDKAALIRNSVVVNEPTKEKKKHILWIARSQSWKRPEVFIELAEAISDERFVMIMPVDIVSNETERLIEKAKAVTNLEFISHVEFTMSQQYFDKAKMLINTSRWEGFPNTFLQAGMASIPIVSLNVDPDNFIKNNQCGYVCEDNFSTLLNWVKFLIKNDEARAEAGKNCYLYIKRDHNIQRNIEIWKMLISDDENNHSSINKSNNNGAASS